MTALTQVQLDSKSCTSGKEFRGTITSPLVFTGEPVTSGAEFIGHVQACNHDESDKLALAVVVVDSLKLPTGQTVPVIAILQAVGPPPPPSRVVATGSDIGYVASVEFHQDMRANDAAQQNSDIAEVARRGPSTVGLIDRSSTGVIGLKHVAFENAATGSSIAWMLTAQKGTLEVPAGSQIVFRMTIAAPASK